MTPVFAICRACGSIAGAEAEICNRCFEPTELRCAPLRGELVSWTDITVGPAGMVVPYGLAVVLLSGMLHLGRFILSGNAEIGSDVVCNEVVNGVCVWTIPTEGGDK